MLELPADFEALLRAHAPQPEEQGTEKLRDAIALAHRRLEAARAQRLKLEREKLCAAGVRLASASSPAHEDTRSGRQHNVWRNVDQPRRCVDEKPGVAQEARHTTSSPSVRSRALAAQGSTASSSERSDKSPAEAVTPLSRGISSFPPSSGASTESVSKRMGECTPAAPSARTAAAAVLALELQCSPPSGDQSYECSAATRIQACVRAFHVRSVLRSRHGRSTRIQLVDVLAMLHDADAPGAGEFERNMVPGLKMQRRKQSSDLIDLIARPIQHRVHTSRSSSPQKAKAKTVRQKVKVASQMTSSSAISDARATCSTRLNSFPRFAAAVESAATTSSTAAQDGPNVSIDENNLAIPPHATEHALDEDEGMSKSGSADGGGNETQNQGPSSVRRPFLKRRSVTQVAQTVDWTNVGSRVLSHSLDYSSARAASTQLRSARERCGKTSGSSENSRRMPLRPPAHAQILAAQSAGRLHTAEASTLVPGVAIGGGNGSSMIRQAQKGHLRSQAGSHTIRNALAALIAKDARCDDGDTHLIGAEGRPAQQELAVDRHVLEEHTESVAAIDSCDDVESHSLYESMGEDDFPPGLSIPRLHPTPHPSSLSEDDGLLNEYDARGRLGSSI